jgi:hypothetical protein
VVLAKIRFRTEYVDSDLSQRPTILQSPQKFYDPETVKKC